MDNQVRRSYVRTSNWHITAEASEDGEQWFKVQVHDIAANGLMLLTDRLYSEGDELWLQLHIDPNVINIFGKVDMFTIEAKAVIKGNRGFHNNMHTFGLMFTEISSNDQIHLDELIRLTIARYGGSEHFRD